jgi:hypothetical protein
MAVAPTDAMAPPALAPGVMRCAYEGNSALRSETIDVSGELDHARQGEVTRCPGDVGGSRTREFSSLAARQGRQVFREWRLV